MSGALQPLQKFFVGPTGLFDDGPQRSVLEIARMKGNGHQMRRHGIISVGTMFRGPQQSEAVSLQNTNHDSGPQSRQAPAHAPTSMVSQPASSGIGRFNWRRQARTFSIASRAISLAS